MRIRPVVVLLLVAAAFFVGYRSNYPQVAASKPTDRHILRYACPMHPDYTSDRAGDAPCCGMRLQPVYAGGPAGLPASASVPGAVHVNAARQQLIGVRTAEVRLNGGSQALRVPGRVAVDESRLYRLVAAVDGWIVSIGQNTAGTFVHKDDVLASYYTREFLSAQQSLLYALNTEGKLYGGILPQQAALNVQVAVDALRTLGMSEVQIHQVQQAGKVQSEIHIHSPVIGFVIARNISPAQRFDKGAELYRIADLSHVWVITDIFEKDREFIRPGATAKVRYRGREYAARMADVLPQFDSQSRTLKTRLELDNPEYSLRPDVFVDVEMDADVEAALIAPADAVIDTGRRKTVYVDKGDGYFEPRSVGTGWRYGDQVQITSGLMPGERIVVSGNFLIDSESRMKLAATAAPAAQQAPAATARDPICGMDVDTKAPKPITSKHAGKTYYFCSEHCKKTFDANPSKYVPQKHAAGSAERGRS